MSTHAPSSAPTAPAAAPVTPAPAAPAQAVAPVQNAAPTAAPSSGGAVSNYLRNVKNHVVSGLGNIFWGTPAELLKGVVDVTDREPWRKSAVAPLGRIALNTVVRPFTAVKELFNHDGHWGFNLGKAGEELTDIVTVPLHECVDMGSKAASALVMASHRFFYGAGEILRAPFGQSGNYHTTPSVGGHCLPSTQCLSTMWS